MRASTKGWIALVLGGFLAASTARAQEWHQGKGRFEGVITNEKGEPIAGATISLRYHGAGTELKTDKSGHWAILGLTGGNWDIDASAPGYQSKKISVPLSELTRIPSIKMQLDPEVKKETPPAQNEVRVGGKTISKEAAEALEKGNLASQARNFPEAEANFLKALPELPNEPSLLFSLALTFYFENKADQALEYARKTVAVDAENTNAWLMVSEIELQKGNLDAGKEALGKVPADRIKTPEPFMNIGILYYNKKRLADADEAFSRAIALKPDLAQAYYYRGLERYAAKRPADAKADLLKSLELDPKGADADTAKEILKSIK